MIFQHHDLSIYVTKSHHVKVYLNKMSNSIKLSHINVWIQSGAGDFMVFGDMINHDMSLNATMLKRNIFGDLTSRFW